MYSAVTSVEATDDFRLVLEFDNAEKRIFNALPILDFGRFIELKDINQFKRVHISFDTIEWENELDLDPEYLYAKSEPATEPYDGSATASPSPVS
ncbi:MAG: DUF2442 domain-containing protein [Kiritimatiellae bacterium]|nr:DUF2442 domain-containing protein [Kiritimatiellia bacterium]MDD4737292.1 DUF2442 domain-containing protein [Kiritimatiellia bacterium]